MPELQPVWIDTADGVRDAARLCGAARRIALDTEADSMHSYFHKVCLIQVSADGHHVVVDPLAVSADDLRPLWQIIEDPAMPVLMHGADYDVRILDRDYGVRIAGLQDSQIMAQLLGEEKTGLSALLAKELGVTLDKKHQRADWGRRPLGAAQLAYATADTAHLGELVDRFRTRLEELGRWGWAVEEFRKLECVRHHTVEPDPRAFERVKGGRGLRGEARDRLYSLYEWRDRIARSLDVPPFKVLGNAALLTMAQNPPSDLAGLAAIDGVGQRAVRRWGRDLLRLLEKPRRAPKFVRAPRQPPPDAAVRQRLKRLLAVRDAKAEELAVQPGLLCPKAAAESVAGRQPACASREDLTGAGLDGWRLEVLGGAFLEALGGG